MFFGVSIYCQSSSVARDSIAYGVSSDGINYTFKGYLIEPTYNVCLEPPSSWPTGTALQLNDPAAIVMSSGTDVALTYSAAVHGDGPNGNDCGNIGIATFNTQTDSIVYRNDDYVVAPDTAAYCYGGGSGFGRPSFDSLDGLAGANNELWFDDSGVDYKIPISNINSLSVSNIVSTGLDGGDIDVHTIGPYTLMFANGNGNGGDGPIEYYYQQNGGSWSSINYLTSLDGQAWDQDYQGSPDLFVQPDTCADLLYLAGAQLNAAKTAYQTIRIAVAVPSDNRIGAAICAQK